MRLDPTSARLRAENIIDAHGIGLPCDALKRELRVATQFRAQRVQDELPIGASRFGGRPDVPSSFVWPRWEGYPEPDRVLRGDQAEAYKRVLAMCKQQIPEGDEIRIPQGCRPTHLSFLAQLSLAEIPVASGLLPAGGWLYFFYDADQQPWGFDPRNRGAARVIYVEADASSIARTDAPSNTNAFSPSALHAEVVATLPTAAHCIGLALEAPALEAYSVLVEEHLGLNDPHHRLLGWPNQIQGEMDRECQLVTHGVYCGSPEGYHSPEAKLLEAGVEDWMLLLQLATDEKAPGWMWGDAGFLYFWIRKQDLAERRFENVWAILQSH